MMRILFKGGLLQPLAGDNGWAFSIFSVGREACWLFSSHFSSAVISSWSNVWNLRKSSLFHEKGRGWGLFLKKKLMVDLSGGWSEARAAISHKVESIR